MRTFDGKDFVVTTQALENGWGVRGGIIATPPRRSGDRRAHHRLQASDQAPPKA